MIVGQMLSAATEQPRAAGYLEYVLPLIVLLMAFILKLAVDRTVDLPSVIYAVIDLPVDILFLALSFLAAFTITTSDNASSGLTSFLIILVGAVAVIVLSRRARSQFDSQNLALTLTFGVLSYLLAVPGLAWSVLLVIGRVL